MVLLSLTKIINNFSILHFPHCVPLFHPSVDIDTRHYHLILKQVPQFFPWPIVVFFRQLPPPPFFLKNPCPLLRSQIYSPVNISACLFCRVAFHVHIFSVSEVYLCLWCQEFKLIFPHQMNQFSLHYLLSNLFCPQ